MSDSQYALRLAPGSRQFEVCKFRDRVAALETEKSVVKVERRIGGRPADERFVVTAGGQGYEGSRESVGTSAQASSCYVAVRVTNGVMTMSPIGDWYAFRQQTRHDTIGLDEAEELMKSKDRLSLLADQRLQKLRKDRDDDDDDDGKGGKKRAAAGSSRGGGGGKAVKREVDDDDEFDDGAGPNWAAAADRDEDGNDGLDMADEELFEDDEDDSFEAAKARDRQFGWVSTDDVEMNFHGDMEDARHAFEERKNRQLAEIAQAKEEEGDDDDDDEGAGGVKREIDEVLEDADEDDLYTRLARATQWGTQTKADLKAERRELRREDDSDEDDDEEDGSSEIRARVDRSLEAERRATLAKDAAAVKASASGGGVKTEDAAGTSTGAGGKRALSPGAEASAKRAKAPAPAPGKEELNKIESAAAAAGGGGRVGLVAEKDLVLFLHKKGPLPLKEVVKSFNAFFKENKSDKSAFIEMMKGVAYTIKQDDGTLLVKLFETTLVKYGLELPH